MKNANLCLKKTVIRNTKDVDIVVKDCFGTEHVIWPGRKKKMIVLKREKE